MTPNAPSTKPQIFGTRRKGRVLLMAYLAWACLPISAACTKAPDPEHYSDHNNNPNHDQASSVVSNKIASLTAQSTDGHAPSFETSTHQIVIWPFVPSRDRPESLDRALNSGLITHVAIFSGNRLTSNTLNKPHTRKAIEMAKRADVELILVRYLWPSKPIPQARLEALWNVEFYVQEIERLRAEAARIGAKYTCLDMEAYGRTPIRNRLQSKERFSSKEFARVVDAVKKAVERVGKVDYVLPAGSMRRNHPYNAFALLGQRRISEHTYYDNQEILSSIKYPYEIAGMYMNVTKENKKMPWLSFYLPKEVFGNKAHVWKEKDGLMIWPREHRASEVAQMLMEFALKHRPKQDDQNRGDN